MTLSHKEILQLENIYNAIYNGCESRLYYPPENYQHIYQKILHAATILYYGGLRSLQHKDVSISSTKDYNSHKVTELLTLIHRTMAETEFPEDIEQKIKKLIKDYNFNPDELLVPHRPVEQEYLETQFILNGIS